VFESIREPIKKLLSGKLTEVAFSTPWVCRKTPHLSRLPASNGRRL
jgi:hypothetical protein